MDKFKYAVGDRVVVKIGENSILGTVLCRRATDYGNEYWQVEYSLDFGESIPSYFLLHGPWLLEEYLTSDYNK